MSTFSLVFSTSSLLWGNCLQGFTRNRKLHSIFPACFLIKKKTCYNNSVCYCCESFARVRLFRDLKEGLRVSLKTKLTNTVVTVMTCLWIFHLVIVPAGHWSVVPLPLSLGRNFQRRQTSMSVHRVSIQCLFPLWGRVLNSLVSLPMCKRGQVIKVNTGIQCPAFVYNPL